MAIHLQPRPAAFVPGLAAARACQLPRSGLPATHGSGHAVASQSARSKIPVRSEVAVGEGCLRIVQEGRALKFDEHVEQITFSGQLAAEKGKPVLYVTERCVFQLRREGLELVEVAPGIDVERDIVAHMRFKPIINTVRPMDARLFAPEPIDLRARMLDLNLADRLAYDPERNILFLNFEGMHVREAGDVGKIQKAVESLCRDVGQRVAVVVNYDAFQIEQSIADAYAQMVRDLEATFYTRVSRYTTSAFMRMKLGQVLIRSVRPHLFETRAEAQAFHDIVLDNG
jgi:propionate CoA-transferase